MKDKSQSPFTNISIFIFWPFLALILAIRDYKSIWSKNIIWFFVIFFGSTFVISSEGIDINAYKEDLLLFYEKDNSLQEFFDYSFFKDKGEEDDKSYIDFFQPLITYYLAKFTNNYYILFSLFGAVFGYFFSRNLSYIFNLVKTKTTTVHTFIFVLLFCLNPFWNINGFRFYMAMNLYLFGILRFLFNGGFNKKYLIYCLFTPFIHFSFAIVLVVSLIFLFNKGNIRLLLYILFITSLITEINVNFIGDLMKTYLPSSFNDRANSYGSNNYAQEVRETFVDKAWYTIYSAALLQYSIIALVYFIFQYAKSEWKKNTELFSFILTFYIIANLYNLVPSGGRFLAIAQTLVLVYFLSLMNINEIRQKLFNNFSSLMPFLSIAMAFSLRIGVEVTNIEIIFLNPLVSYFVDWDESILTIIKGKQ